MEKIRLKSHSHNKNNLIDLEKIHRTELKYCNLLSNFKGVYFIWSLGNSLVFRQASLPLASIMCKFICSFIMCPHYLPPFTTTVCVVFPACLPIVSNVLESCLELV